MPAAATPPFLSTTASRETVATVLRKDGLLAKLADDASLAKFAHSAFVGGPFTLQGTQLITLLSRVASLPQNAAPVRDGYKPFFIRWFNHDASEAVVTESLTNFLDIALKFLAAGSDVTAVQVVDAVYRIYDPLLSTNTAPSPLSNSPALSSLQSTPMRANSASHMDSRTTCSAISPKLLGELQDHLWVVESNSFFDHFFPISFGHVPLPPPFPPIQSEANVVKWVKDYRPDVGNANSNSPSWRWGSSGQRPLIHRGANGDRKLDLFTHSQESEHDWSNVGVVSALKYRSKETSIGDFNVGLLVQLGGYARYVFAKQPRRRFVHGFTLICATMQCWVFTRSGGVASPSFRLDTRDGLQRWRQVALNYLHSDDIGQAPLSERRIRIGSLNLRLESPRPFFCTRAIVTRGTTCWHASAVDLPGSLGYPFVLKESWRYRERPSEGELLERANKAGVQGIDIHLAHYDDEETVHTILGPCREASRVVDLDSPSSLRYRGTVSSASSKRLKSSASSKFGATRAVTPLEAVLEQTQSTSRAGTIVIPDRIRTLVVMSRGRAISEFTSPLELLRSFRDAIRGHYSLLTTGRILHRDVSINNIMMTHPSYPRPDKFSGFLIDLDLAVPVDSSGIPCDEATHRTGTYEFISIENLRCKPGFVHTFHDDLQSFFFVFLWLCYRRPLPSRSANPFEQITDYVGMWECTTLAAAASAKSDLVNDEREFEKMLAGFKEELTRTDAVQNAARKARAALWPHTRLGRRISREELQQVQVRENFYQEFLAAFETGGGWAE